MDFSVSVFSSLLSFALELVLFFCTTEMAFAYFTDTHNPSGQRLHFTLSFIDVAGVHNDGNNDNLNGGTRAFFLFCL
jgi:hypothetical protein